MPGLRLPPQKLFPPRKYAETKTNKTGGANVQRKGYNTSAEWKEECPVYTYTITGASLMHEQYHIAPLPPPILSFNFTLNGAFGGGSSVEDDTVGASEGPLVEGAIGAAAVCVTSRAIDCANGSSSGD